MKLSLALVIGGIAIGVISALTLVSRYPINIAFLGLGAAVYFAGKWFEKEGK